jgi:hypothetical protein
MQLRYGSFSHPVAEAAVVIRRDAKVNEGGEVYAFQSGREMLELPSSY